MNWFKKSQTKNITIDDIIRVVDQWILLNEEFSEEELLIACELHQFSNDEQGQHALPKAAQVTKKKYAPQRSKLPPNVQDALHTTRRPEEKVRLLALRGYSTGQIAKILKIPYNDVYQILRSLWENKQQQDEARIEHFRNPTRDIIDKYVGGPEPINTKMIAKQLGAKVSVVKQVLESMGLTPNTLRVQRRMAVRDMIVDLIFSMKQQGRQVGHRGSKGITAMGINEEFTKRYKYTLGHSQVNRILKVCNVVLDERKASYSLIDAFLTYIGEKAGSVAKAGNNPRKLVGYVDSFINEFGHLHGFTTPMEKEDLKRLLMAKIQLRDRAAEIAEYDDTRLYNYVSRNYMDQVLDLLSQGVPIPQISRKTGIPGKDIQTFYNLWQLKRTPLDYSQNQPSYFLTDQEQTTQGKNRMNWFKQAKKWKDKIPGGRADGKTPADFERSQVEKGKEVEYEHTDDPDTAREIAMDHLDEHGEYYTLLEHMEGSLKDLEKREKKK